MPSPRRSSKPEPAFDSAWGSAADIADAVTAGRVSALQVTEDALARIMERDPLLNAFTDVLAERARKRAQADRRGARREASRWDRSPACRSR